MPTRRLLLASAGAIGAGAAGAVGFRAWRDREPPSPPLQDARGHLLWRNWSGIQSAYPTARAAPASEEEAVDLVAKGDAPIRPVGAAHSFMPLAVTSGTLVSLDRLTGLVSHDAAKNEATIRAGTRLGDLGAALAAIGQEMPNLPDINKQSLAGATATATHGTGRDFRAVHGEIVSMHIATPERGLIECSAEKEPDIFNAACVNLGAFGIVTQMTLRNKPLKRIRKRTWVADAEQVMADWPKLRAEHRNVEFYTVPFTGLAIVIACDETDAPLKPRGPDTDTEGLMSLKMLRDVLGLAPPLRKAAAQAGFKDQPPEEAVDEGWKLLSNDRPVKFNEMEYHLPLDAQIPALKEVIAAIEKHRNDVFFPIEARVIAPDDAWLSPFYQRASGSIAVHAYYKDDYKFFFDLIEPIFRRHEGRPHWGKLNSLKAADFAALYPRFKDAMAVRAALDPKGRMLNPYLVEATGHDAG